MLVFVLPFPDILYPPCRASPELTMSVTGPPLLSIGPIFRQLRQLLPSPADEGLLSVTLDFPQLAGNGLPELPAPYFFWQAPHQGRSLLGIGVAESITASGDERLKRLGNRFLWQQRHWQRLAPNNLRPFAAAFVGVAFDADDPMTGEWQGFANSLLHVPSILLHRQPEGATLTFSCRKSCLHDTAGQLQRWLNELEGLLQACARAPHQTKAVRYWRCEETPPHHAWVKEVEQAISDIQDGKLQKVVCARSRTLHLQHTLQAAPIVSSLQRRYPDCYQVAVNLNGTPLVAATPERLVQLQQRRLHCDALGGSAPRSTEPARDRLLAHGLQQSPKTRQEHRFVVDYIREALAPVCRQIEMNDEPELFRLSNIQHLRTRISAEVPTGTTLLELAARLHPTPAVCGVPLPQAQQWLRQNETINRGWYSGAVGWLGADGDGELNVMLRCALLQGSSATLYAGGGVVSDSVPQEEWEETELKLEALFGAPQAVPLVLRAATAAQ